MITIVVVMITNGESVLGILRAEMCPPHMKAFVYIIELLLTSGTLSVFARAEMCLRVGNINGLTFPSDTSTKSSRTVCNVEYKNLLDI